MTKITEADVDTVYDAIETLTVCGQLLSQGDTDTKTQVSISWLLGSTSKHLGDILTILEELQHDQQPAASNADADLLELGSEVLALHEKFRQRRQGLGDAS